MFSLLYLQTASLCAKLFPAELTTDAKIAFGLRIRLYLKIREYLKVIFSSLKKKKITISACNLLLLLLLGQGALKFGLAKPETFKKEKSVRLSA